MIVIPPGTLVEVQWTRIVAEIMVVECSQPLTVRRATYWERFRYWWNSRRQTAAEFAAATEAIQAVEKAKAAESA